MLNLYPDIEPYARHRLAVDEPHELYLEESGNPDGIPVLVVHSGPGGGCEDYHRRFFDAERFRIILMDQRGAGRSTPLAELEGNSTDSLVQDMETIRQFLGIDRWLLFGGSFTLFFFERIVARLAPAFKKTFYILIFVKLCKSFHIIGSIFLCMNV